MEADNVNRLDEAAGEQSPRSASNETAGKSDGPGTRRERVQRSRRGPSHDIRTRDMRKSSEALQPSLPIASSDRTENPEAVTPAAGAQQSNPARVLGLTLKQKLAEVRRRISYIQKRGHNERFNYSYVTAADLAGAVGDALADLEVIVIPRLESISYESISPNPGYQDRLTRVIMTYTFMDVDSAEELKVKTPGEGRDPGDKGPYKAMTGALKYALLQTFLIATGDDPEDERVEVGSRTGNNGNGTGDSVISNEQVTEIQLLIEQTGTDVAKMLEYFKISKIEKMTTVMYGRAVQALRRKPVVSANHGGTHAKN